MFIFGSILVEEYKKNFLFMIFNWIKENAPAKYVERDGYLD